MVQGHQSEEEMVLGHQSAEEMERGEMEREEMEREEGVREMEAEEMVNLLQELHTQLYLQYMERKKESPLHLDRT